MSNGIKAEIKGTDLIITLPMQKPTPSASGKSLVVASTYGNQTVEAVVQGKNITIGVNAYISSR